MDHIEYKERKLDKLTRDIVQMVNKTPSFGYGEVIDSVTKTAITNYLLSLVTISEIRDTDIEILTQSISDEVTELSVKLVGKIKSYKNLVEDVA